MPIATVLLDLALAGELIGERERHTHLLVQGECNAGAHLPGITQFHVARHLGVDLRADVAERVFHVVGVGQAAEQHGRVEGLDQRDTRGDRPDTVAGRQVFGHRKVIVCRVTDQFDAVRVVTGRRLDAQGKDRVGPIGRFVQKLVGKANVYIADGRVAGYGCVRRHRACATGTAGGVR
ncbi:hypothetical protein D3C72_1670640 [compost metagenome]